MGTRIHVSLEDFLRVTIAGRDEFDTVESAANEVGMTTASFKQRLTTSRKRYPSLYDSVERYSTDRRSVPTEEEAAAILATLVTPTVPNYSSGEEYGV